MSNYKGEIRIEGAIEGSRTDPIDIPCKATEVEALQVMYAAAPELLAALQNLVDRNLIKGIVGADHYDEVLEALSKAKGEIK